MVFFVIIILCIYLYIYIYVLTCYNELGALLSIDIRYNYISWIQLLSEWIYNNNILFIAINILLWCNVCHNNIIIYVIHINCNK